MTQNSSTPKIIGIIVAILVCCACIAIAAAGVLVYRAYQNTPSIELTAPFNPPAENTTTPLPPSERSRAGRRSRVPQG